METGRIEDSGALPLGTQVGSWRVVGPPGSGSYGIVYRVERVGQEAAGPFALKVARRPLDPRFEREWELLSRIRHANVPRFEVQGWVTLPGGVPYPYVVMEWVEGMPLYEWGAREPRTSRQVMRMLAQVARALEATHAVEGVHRDVKGDNVLVRTADGTAVLIDFGSGDFRGARVLTRRPPPPGTDRYWSRECLRFQLKWLRQPAMRYEAGPADDLYALGVTAYRLVTGVYPPPGVECVVTEDEPQFIEPEPIPAETRVRLSPELAALIAQLLAKEPTARGTAAEVAQALERAADTAGPEADQPITPIAEPAPIRSIPALPVPVPVELKPRRVSRSRARSWSPWRVVAVGVFLLLMGWWIEQRPSGDVPGTVAEKEPRSGTESRRGKGDAEPIGLGDAESSAPASEALPEPARGGISKALPDKPLPGQRLPPCEKPEVEINGGCWVHLVDRSPPCGDRSYEWKNKCYSASMGPPRSPTSDPP